MKDHGLPPQIVLTGPLLEGTDAKLVDGRIVGDKMSKSLGNYVGIAEPPGDMFGKLLSITDDLMWRYYDLLSALGTAEIRALKAEHPKAAKVRLAREMVTRFHSAEAARAAEEEFERVHVRGELPEQIEERAYPLAGAADVGLLRLICECGLAASNSEARRLVTQGGVTVNGVRAADPKATLVAGEYVLQVGKRRFAKVKVG